MKRILAQKSFIRNALITIYILAVLGFSATARAQMTINPIFTDYKPVPTQTYVGEVTMTPNHDFYLVVSETEVYRLATNVELHQFHGQLVEVEAYELEHKIGPVRNLSMDPLPGHDGQTAAVPVLVVFGISELAQ